MTQHQEKHCKACDRHYRNETDFLTGTSLWRLCSQGHLWFECSCKSTLMIPKGKFPWYNPANFMEPELGIIFNRIAALKDLPHISNQVMNLLVLVEEADIDATRLAKSVRQEPFIADEVYRLANHLRCQRTGERRELSSLEHAISYIGFSALKDILVGASIKSFEFNSEKFTSENFWMESMICARIAEYLSRNLGFTVNADEAFHAGLLLNIGKVVMAICLPNQADLIQSLIKDPKTTDTWRGLEAGFGLGSHVQLGQIAASLWGLSNFVQEAIAFHHEHERFDARLTKYRPLEFYAIVALANQLSHWVSLQPERMDEDLMFRCGVELGQNEDALIKHVESMQFAGITNV